MCATSNSGTSIREENCFGLLTVGRKTGSSLCLSNFMLLLQTSMGSGSEGRVHVLLLYMKKVRQTDLIHWTWDSACLD